MIGLQVGAALDSPVVLAGSLYVGPGVHFPSGEEAGSLVVSFLGSSTARFAPHPWLVLSFSGSSTWYQVDPAFTIPYDLSAESASAHLVLLSLISKGSSSWVSTGADMVWDVSGLSSLVLSVTNAFRSASFPGTSAVEFNIGTTAIRDLSVSFAGSSSVEFGAFGVDPKYQPRTLYLYLNVGVGFDIDTPTGALSFTAPDGQVRSFPRWLYLYLNVGVGFNPTDDASTQPGFISQTFPDGNTWEFPRWLYLLLYVYAPPSEFGRGYYGPSPQLDTITRAKPPQLPYP